MRASVRVILALLTVAAVGAPSPAPAGHFTGGGPDGGPVLEPALSSDVDGAFRDWRGEPTDVPGDWTYSEGEYILTDHPFDDHGADADGDDGRTLDPYEHYSMTEGANAATSFAGDYVYPDDPAFANNAADIVETRVAADDDAWYLLVKLNTLIDPERTAIGAAIRPAEPADAPLSFLQMHGQEGTLGVQPIDVVADAEANTFEARIPRSVYDPSASEQALIVGAGLWDLETDNWWQPPNQRGFPPSFDLAYNGPESMDSYWREVNQSRSRMVGPSAKPFIVDFADLVPPCDGCPVFKPRTYGWTTRVFRSGQNLGEGVVPQTIHSHDEVDLGYKFYRSSSQPYALYAPPPAGPNPRPLVLLMHFLGGNHMSYPITSKDGIEAWAESLDAIVAMPMGRGEAGWYEGPAEKDVFEVWRDVASHHAVDRERVYLAGMSMGGFGTWRLGALYPDQFAKAIVWSGPITPNAIWPAPAPATWPNQNPPMCDRDAEGCGYALTDLFGNVGSLPYLVVHGGLDELVPATGAQQWMKDFDEQGPFPFRFVLYPTRRHETSFPGSTPDLVRHWLGDLPTRAVDPGHVRYKVVRDLLQPEYGLNYDGAYWVSGMELAEGAPEGIIDANASDEPDVLKIGPLVGADDLGPYTIEEEQVRRRPASSSGVHVDATGLKAAAIDTLRLHWDSDEHWVHVETGAPLRLTLVGDFPPSTTVEGAPFTIVDGDVVLDLAAGESSITIGH